MIKFRKKQDFRVVTVKRGVEFYLFWRFWWFQKGVTRTQALNKDYLVRWTQGTGYEYSPYVKGVLWYGCGDNL